MFFCQTGVSGSACGPALSSVRRVATTPPAALPGASLSRSRLTRIQLASWLWIDGEADMGTALLGPKSGSWICMASGERPLLSAEMHACAGDATRLGAPRVLRATRVSAGGRTSEMLEVGEHVDVAASTADVASGATGDCATASCLRRSHPPTLKVAMPDVTRLQKTYARPRWPSSVVKALACAAIAGTSTSGRLPSEPAHARVNLTPIIQPRNLYDVRAALTSSACRTYQFPSRKARGGRCRRSCRRSCMAAHDMRCVRAVIASAHQCWRTPHTGTGALRGRHTLAPG